MKVIPIGENVYGPTLCGFFHRAFPSVSQPSHNELVDILADIIIGDKNLRHGPMPSVEVQFNIRRIIRQAVTNMQPIPVLIPWGGRKTVTAHSIDIAEVSAIRQVIGVMLAVKQHYAPGIRANIRIEDINALWLYRGQHGLLEDVEAYSSDMQRLLSIVKPGSIWKDLQGIRENEMTSYEQYEAVCKRYAPLLHQAIIKLEMGAMPHAIEEMEELKRAGWVGDISKEQREYYLGRYKHLYSVSDHDAAAMLADYFAGSKARYDLGTRCNPVVEGVDGFIQANFAHPVPNAPAGLFDSTVYWRTVPFNQARTHIAPWRGKGYLRVERNECIPKVVSWTDPLVGQLEHQMIAVADTDTATSVVIESDFLIKD